MMSGNPSRKTKRIAPSSTSDAGSPIERSMGDDVLFVVRKKPIMAGNFPCIIVICRKARGATVSGGNWFHYVVRVMRELIIIYGKHV